MTDIRRPLEQRPISSGPPPNTADPRVNLVMGAPPPVARRSRNTRQSLLRMLRGFHGEGQVGDDDGLGGSSQKRGLLMVFYYPKRFFCIEKEPKKGFLMLEH